MNQTEPDFSGPDAASVAEPAPVLQACTLHTGPGPSAGSAARTGVALRSRHTKLALSLQRPQSNQHSSHVQQALTWDSAAKLGDLKRDGAGLRMSLA